MKAEMFSVNCLIKPNLLFIGNFLSSKGKNRCVGEELAENLRSLGYQVIMASEKISKPLRLINMIVTIIRHYNDYDIAYVEVFSGSAFIWAEITTRLIKILDTPIILNLHGGNLPAFSEKFPNRVLWVLSSASHVVSPSPYLQKKLKRFRDDIQVLPNPIHIEDFAYHRRRIVNPKLIWVRAFHEIYNPSLALKVLSRLVENFPDVQLTMVGPDKGDGSLERMKGIAKDLGVIDHIHLTGGVHKEEVPEYLSRGDIFINTTNFDNTPVSVIEAMACGLPIVTTNVGGIPWLVEDGVDGLLVPPDDPDAMAAAIECILKDLSLASKLSHNARQKAESFDWSIVLPQWENVFSELLIK